MIIRWTNSVADALLSLRVHWLSTAFGLVSVAAAVAAFSTTLLVSGAMTDVLGKRFEYLGRDAMTVSVADGENHNLPMSISTYRALARIAGISAIAPIIELSGKNSRASHGKHSVVTQAIATTSDYFRVSSLSLKFGRGLAVADDQRATKTCVIGSELAARLGLQNNPLGQYMQLGEASVRVIGVLAPTMESGKFISLDYVVIISMETARAIGVDTGQIDRALVMPSNTAFAGDLRDRMARLVSTREWAEKGKGGLSARVETRDQLIKASKEASEKQGLVVSLIASLSLLVSSIGIMNVAYLGVTERFREIGLRRAVGASSVGIQRLLLIESLLVSIGGDFIGIGISMLAAQPVARLFGIQQALPLDFSKIGLVSLLAIGITVGFCLAPARRAATVDPVAALRSD
ncbi:ABC transporter permease [Frateuria sp. Soil773]|uniref:ABC transporter permease n=1 Tax=Frateuria sp. Soil773 TaxID=1736407 RepID=UPI0009E78B1D|nr:ABC transporter permease [Frateuria sp. Soil773]